MGRHFKRMEAIKRVCEKIDGVTGWIFTTSRPTAVPVQMDEFLIVSIPVGIYDQVAYQDTFLRIDIFVREVSGGREPIERIEELQKSIMEKFPFSDEVVHCHSAVMIPGGNDGTGFYFVRIQARLIIT